MEVFTSLFKIQAPDVILDVGAHWGFYPAFLAKSTYADNIRKIIAVEADPLNQAILAKTVMSISKPAVIQINAAISENDEDIDLYSGSDSCRQTYQSVNTTAVGTVKAICLDSLSRKFLNAGERITHIKLDIDGYEPAFFTGGESALRQHKPIILTEFWAKGLIASGVDLEKFWKLLNSNYTIKESCFDGKTLKSLTSEDLPYLIKKTIAGITDLVLIPRDL